MTSIPDARPNRRQPGLLARLRARAAVAPSLHLSSAGALAVLVTGAGIGYLAQVVTARLIGGANFGVYAYVLAWVTLLAYLSTLGFHVSLLRLGPAYRARAEWRLASGLMRFATLGTAFTGTVIALVGAAALLMVHGLDPDLFVTFLVGLAAAPILALQLVGAARVRVFGSVVAALGPERLLRDSLALLLLAAAVFVGGARADAPVAMTAMLGSAAATLWLVTWLAQRVRPPELDCPRCYAVRDWIRPTLPLTAIMAADVVMTRSGVIVLGLVGDTRAAGIFAAAFSLATLTALPRMAVAAAFAPTVADLHARGDRAGLQALIRRAAQLSLAGSACLAAPLMLAAPVLLALFGRDFAAGAPAVVILVLGQLFAAAAGPQQHLMTMTGREPAGALMQAGGAALGLAAGFLVARPFGPTGVAVAASAGVVAWNLAMFWFAWTRLGIRPGLLATSPVPGDA